MYDYWEWVRQRILQEREIQEWAAKLSDLNPWLEDENG